MGSVRIGPRPVAASVRRCVVTGCAERPGRDILICRVHALALWRPEHAPPP